MIVTVSVSLKVEPVEGKLQPEKASLYLDSAVEAVRNAVERAYENGFTHALDTELSLSVTDVELERWSTEE
jgi:hypothetical protein